MTDPVIFDGKDAEDIPWIDFEHPGCYIKPLGQHPESLAVGGYFRMEPNSMSAEHSHPSDQFSYILEGEVSVDGKMYGPGSFFHYPAGVVHGPLKTGEKGMLLFACYSGPSGQEAMLKLKTIKENNKSE